LLDEFAQPFSLRHWIGKENFGRSRRWL